MLSETKDFVIVHYDNYVYDLKCSNDVIFSQIEKLGLEKVFEEIPKNSFLDKESFENFLHEKHDRFDQLRKELFHGVDGIAERIESEDYENAIYRFRDIIASELRKIKERKPKFTKSELMDMNLYGFMGVLYVNDVNISMSEMDEYIGRVGNDINRFKRMLDDVGVFIDMRVADFIKKNRHYINILSQELNKNGGTIKDQIANIEIGGMPEDEKKKIINFIKFTYQGRCDTETVLDGTYVYAVLDSGTIGLELLQGIITDKIKEIENETREAPPNALERTKQCPYRCISGNEKQRVFNRLQPRNSCISKIKFRLF